MACLTTFLSKGCVPQRTDTTNTLLKRIAGTEAGPVVASGNLSGAGSPIGVVTPTAVNQWYRDTTNDNYYWATGLTSADWQLTI